MKLNKLTDTLYLNENLINTIKYNEIDICTGLSFHFKDYNGSVLDFFQKNIYYVEDVNKLNLELKEYNYFLMPDDVISIVIEDDGNKIIEFSNVNAKNLIIGNLREEFIKLSWLNNKKNKNLKCIIKKTNSNFDHEFFENIQKDYLDILIYDIMNFKNRNVFKKIKLKLDNIPDFRQQIRTIKNILEEENAKFSEFDDVLALIRSFEQSNDILPLINIIKNKKNYWKDFYNLKTGI